MTVMLEALPPDEMPVAIILPEFMRRMKDMSATGGGGMNFMGAMPEMYNVVVNSNHPTIQKIAKENSEETQKTIAKQVYDLALLSQGMLTGKDLTNFIKRSVAL
jgi:molecular chaperone HtpG